MANVEALTADILIDSLVDDEIRHVEDLQTLTMEDMEEEFAFTSTLVTHMKLLEVRQFPAF